MNNDINRWIFEIPLEDVQDENYQDSGSDTSCICCGKEVKNVKYMVHMLTSGVLVSSDQDHGEESQGFFPIGNACKNKLPNNFYWKI